MGKEILFTDVWNNYLKYFHEEDKDIYFTEEYVKLYECEDDHSECFIYKEDNNMLLFPYLKRKIESLDGDYFDFETPYGYGGPITNTDNPDFINRGFSEFIYSSEENKIVAGFIRFHPILNNHKHFIPKCEVVFDRKTIAMNLEPEIDEIWYEQIHSKHRNSIRKAQKLGLIYYADESLQHLDIFINLYRCTMDRLDADNFYFFDNEYFNKIKKLNKNIFLGLVLCEKEVISGAIFFKYGIFGHYHLAGGLEKFNQYNPNNFLIYNVASYMKEMGVKVFHLGGGTDSSENNSLFRFKRRFSKYEHSFYVGKLILNKNKYEEVCNIWEEKFPEKKQKYYHYLLKYRY